MDQQRIIRSTENLKIIFDPESAVSVSIADATAQRNAAAYWESREACKYEAGQSVDFLNASESRNQCYHSLALRSILKCHWFLSKAVRCVPGSTLYR